MGRGGSSMRGRDGGGGGGNMNPKNMIDIWSYRHTTGNEPFVDAINDGFKALDTDFPGFMQSVNAVNAADIREGTLGYWSPADKQLVMNTKYTDIQTMNDTMDQAAREGFHPSRGNKTGTEAVAIHEAGHALTDYIAQKTGAPGLHAVSEMIVKDAYKASGTKGGVHKFAGAISGYARKNYAETVAEAVHDWYCNGNKAKSASKAIIAELKKYS